MHFEAPYAEGREPSAAARHRGVAGNVLISAEEYARLKRRDRRVLEAGEVSERQIAALREAKVPWTVPDQFADLDAELKEGPAHHTQRAAARGRCDRDPPGDPAAPGTRFRALVDRDHRGE